MPVFNFDQQMTWWDGRRAVCPDMEQLALPDGIQPTRPQLYRDALVELLTTFGTASLKPAEKSTRADFIQKIGAGGDIDFNALEIALITEAVGTLQDIQVFKQFCLILEGKPVIGPARGPVNRIVKLLPVESPNGEKVE